MADETHVQRNFRFPVEQAEWLRRQAFQTRRSQTEIVQEAVAALRAQLERDGEGPDASRALTDRFADGAGVDLVLLRDRRTMWSPDA